MQLESFRDYCLSLKGSTESLPFDQKTLVFKVMNKIFAICDMEKFDGVALKCNPEKALELRAQYMCVQPGFHLNKKHWNTVSFTGEVDDRQIKEWILHSYDCIVQAFPKKVRLEYEQL